jgi:hypothetical protein
MWFSIFIFILTLAMLTASITLSWQGSKDIADFAVSKPIEKTTLRSDSTKNADFLTAQRLFTSDSATIETKYKGKLEAIESDKMNEINVVERNAKGKQATSMSISNTTKYAILNCAFEPCGQPFERRTTFQKYCCEEHRIAAFESRTGRQLKKQAKK